MKKIMSRLLPRFKCQPDTFSIPFGTTTTTAASSSHTHHFVNSSHYNSTKVRASVLVRAQCILSTTPPSTGTSAVLIIEKLRLLSLEPKIDSATTQSPWLYLGAAGPPTTENFEATLASETLLNSEEAIIAAASAEALTLAKAAVKVAKDAAFLVNNNIHSSLTSFRALAHSDPNSLSFKGSQLVESEQAFETGDISGSDSRLQEVDSLQYAVNEPDKEEETSVEEVVEELSRSVAVRSIRQRERKAKRARAVEKAASGVAVVKLGSTIRTKRSALNEVDYFDPLHYIRATTSSSKLLSTTEELELSEGIQDLLKLEWLQRNLQSDVAIGRLLLNGPQLQELISEP